MKLERYVLVLLIGILIGSVITPSGDAKPVKLDNQSRKANKAAAAVMDTVNTTNAYWQGDFSTLSKVDQDALIEDLKTIAGATVSNSGAIGRPVGMGIKISWIVR